MDPQTFSMLNNTVCTSTTRYLSVEFARRHAITSIENRDTTAIQTLYYRGHTEAIRRRHSMFAVCSIQKRSRLESLEFSSSTYKRRAFFMRSFPKHKSHDAKFTLSEFSLPTMFENRALCWRVEPVEAEIRRTPAFKFGE